MDARIRRSRKQEHDGAKRYGGTVNSQSGAGDIRKNDVRTDTESIEFKGTSNTGYRLTLADLCTAWRHALMDGRNVIFGIEFFRTDKFFGVPTRWVIQPEDDYLAMKERIQALEAQLRFYED